jgi:hypothetical protein
VTTIQVNPKNQRRHAGSSRLAAPENTSMLSAVLAHARVRVAHGLLCPCGRQVRPTDVELFDGIVRIICSGCHAAIVDIDR